MFRARRFLRLSGMQIIPYITYYSGRVLSNTINPVAYGPQRCEISAAKQNIVSAGKLLTIITRLYRMGPLSLVLVAGQRFWRLPAQLDSCTHALVWRWGVSGAPLTVEADCLLWTLNELLRDSAILIQPLCLPDAAVRRSPFGLPTCLVQREPSVELRLVRYWL